MFYDRKIRYFDYLENGERVGGSGFAKLEVRDETLRIEITIKGLKDIAGIFPILLLGGGTEKKLGEIVLQRDGGAFRHVCQISERIGETGISYGELVGIRIPIGENREIACRWEAVLSRKADPEKKLLEAQSSGWPHEEMQSEKKKTESPVQLTEELTEELQKEEREENNTEIRQKKDVEDKMQSKPDEDKMIRLQEDKWTQICTIYPHIRPFRDEREYLSISPSDFVLFPAADYRAAHNSFLLHGYYNYHHLILTRVERKGEIIYYLGVPGNYYEKEKQVAVMFGFESFECADEPADYGDFGYYMMRTNI